MSWPLRPRAVARLVNDTAGMLSARLRWRTAIGFSRLVTPDLVRQDAEAGVLLHFYLPI